MMMAEIAISVARKSLPVNLADADGLLDRVKQFREQSSHLPGPILKTRMA